MVENTVTAFLRYDASTWIVAFSGSGSDDAQLWKLTNETRPWTLLHEFGTAASCNDLIVYQGDIYAALERTSFPDRGDVEVSVDGGVNFSLQYSIDHFTDSVSSLQEFGGELFAGERNTDGVEFPQIHARTAGGVWSLRYTSTRSAAIEWTDMKVFSGFLYASLWTNGSDSFGPEIWRTSNGTVWTLAHQFPSNDLEKIGGMEVFQSKLFAAVINDATDNLEIYETSNGTTWSLNTTITRLTDTFINDSTLTTDGTLLFASEQVTGFTSATRVHVYDGSTWSVSVDFYDEDISGFQAHGATRCSKVQYDPTSGKVYAGCGSSGGSTAQIAVMSCPSEDLGTPTDPDEGGGGGGGG